MFHFAEHTAGDEEIYYYHSDHLGSASWITEKNGMPIQYIHYLPYGEILANQRASGYDERFKFTTKELDTESGYYYFGARYLLSELGDFLSPDPLLDQYPTLQPYLYCNGNPLKYIDPDGRDIWELEGTGSVVNKITDKTQDAIRMNGKQISFEPNSITSVNQDDGQTTFTFGDERVASSTFKFLADNSSVEYGLVNSSQKSTIVTQHIENKVNVNGIVDAAMSNNEVIKSIIHNHPRNSGPSGFGHKSGDKQAFQNIENKLGYQIQSYVYQSGTESLWFFTPTNRGNGGLGWNYFYPVQVGTKSDAIPSWMYSIKNFFGYKMKL